MVQQTVYNENLGGNALRARDANAKNPTMYRTKKKVKKKGTIKKKTDAVPYQPMFGAYSCCNLMFYPCLVDRQSETSGQRINPRSLWAVPVIQSSDKIRPPFLIVQDTSLDHMRSRMEHIAVVIPAIQQANFYDNRSSAWSPYVPLSQLMIARRHLSHPCAQKCSLV